VTTSEKKRRSDFVTSSLHHLVTDHKFRIIYFAQPLQ